MKKILTILGIVVVLLVGGLFAARHFAVGYLTPDFVSRYLESQWNCRVDIASLDLKIGSNAEIQLKQVSIGPRDQYANAATPMDERPPMDQANIRIELVKLDAKPSDLLKRHLNVEHLLIQNAAITTELAPDGRATIDRLFDSAPGGAPVATPVSLAGDAGTADASAVPVAVPVDMETDASEEDEEEKDFVAEDMKVSTQAALVELRDSSVTVGIQKSGARVILSDLQVVLKDIDLDASNLAGHNSATFSIGGAVAIEADGEKGSQRLVDLRVSGNGQVAPFNPQTGAVEPAWSSELVLHQGSKVETFPVVEKLQSKLADIDTGGVDLTDFNLSGELTSDAATRLAFRQGRFTLEQPLSLALPDTAFVFQAGSWADTGSNQHEMNGVVIASQELTEKIVSKVKTYLREKVGGTLADAAVDTVLGLAMKDGRIAVEFVTEGDLSKPKVDVVTPIGKVGDLKDTFDGLKDAFKGLFGK